MDIIPYIFLVKIHCPDCDNIVPVNKITHTVTCHNCSSELEIGKDWWQEYVFDDFERVIDYADGEADSAQVMTGDMNMTIATGKRFPRCQTCKSDLSEAEKWTLEELLEASGQGTLDCKRCKTPYAIRKPNDFVSSILDQPILAILNETEYDPEATSAGGKVIMFQCLGCGAGLKVDGSDRVVDCEYCQTSNFLPDDLWRRFKVVPKAQGVFILIKN